jgi:hypothetical protein
LINRGEREEEGYIYCEDIKEKEKEEGYIY